MLILPQAESFHSPHSPYIVTISPIAGIQENVAICGNVQQVMMYL